MKKIFLIGMIGIYSSLLAQVDNNQTKSMFLEDKKQVLDRLDLKLKHLNKIENNIKNIIKCVHAASNMEEFNNCKPKNYKPKFNPKQKEKSIQDAKKLDEKLKKEVFVKIRLNPSDIKE